MISKLLTTLIAAVTLSIMLGIMPCDATSARLKGKTKPVVAGSPKAAAGASDLNKPSMNFSGVEPVIDNPDPNMISPKKDKNQFFDQTP